MIIAFALLAAAAQPADLNVEDLDNGRFRIVVTKPRTNEQHMTRAILDTQAEAARRCQGCGDPVRTQSTEFVAMANGRFQMISIFACRDAAAAQAQPEAPAPDASAPAAAPKPQG